MKKHTLIFACVFVFLIYPVLARAEDWATVQAEGSAPKSAEKTDVDVKKDALDQALRKAVSTALDSLVKEEAIAVNSVENESIESEIFANPRNFILNYRIVTEGWLMHMDSPAPAPPDQAMPNQAGAEYYHVWVEANIDSAQLKNLVSRTTQGEAVSFYKIVILGVTDYDTFKGLLASMSGLASVNDISYDSFYRGNIVLTAKINGNGQDLVERIARGIAGGFVVVADGRDTILVRPAAGPLPADR